MDMHVISVKTCTQSPCGPLCVSCGGSANNEVDVSQVTRMRINYAIWGTGLALREWTIDDCGAVSGTVNYERLIWYGLCWEYEASTVGLPSLKEPWNGPKHLLAACLFNSSKFSKVL